MLLTVSSMPAQSEIQKLLTHAHIENWLRQDLFQAKWWLLLGLTALGMVVWWKLLSQRRLPEILLYAVLMMVVMMGVDEYGEELALWEYPIDILPIFPVITAANLMILPLAYSLVYQHFATWKSFSGVAVLTAALLCFGFEPALAWGGYYQLLKWKYYYSFPVYIAAALVVRWAVVQIFGVAARARKHAGQGGGER
ncbi:MAG TPA: CBO0543 family protein [Selenomonadales bacterium]|nr:CBO0543 family protein [Selenomonadales bacterium]